jgi:hypothetical protein
MSTATTLFFSVNEDVTNRVLRPILHDGDGRCLVHIRFRLHSAEHKRAGVFGSGTEVKHNAAADTN